jgi:hypothetical protein
MMFKNSKYMTWQEVFSETEVNAKFNVLMNFLLSRVQTQRETIKGMDGSHKV